MIKIGTIVNLVYLIIFFWFRYKNYVLKVTSILLALLVTFEIFFSLFYALNFDDHKIDADSTKSNVIGKAAMIFNIGMYAAPAQNIIKVFQTKDQNLIPIHTSIIGFLCSTTWLSYGLLNFDINVVIPNVLGVVFTVFQVVIWVIFWKKSQKLPALQEFIS
jgi:solute carrier family 50 protein (sugar transporter)